MKFFKKIKIKRKIIKVNNSIIWVLKEIQKEQNGMCDYTTTISNEDELKKLTEEKNKLYKELELLL
jgi:hypothetical protein